MNQKETYIIGGKDEPLEHTTKFTTSSPTGAKYQISFWSPVQYDGLILYQFQRLKNEDDDDENESEAYEYSDVITNEDSDAVFNYTQEQTK